MKIEFLISTMNQKDLSFLDMIFVNNDMSQVNVLVINQCTAIDMPQIKPLSDNIRVISVRDRGLSRSRNLALDNAIGDICVIVDEDCVIHGDALDVILQAYHEYPKVAAITFKISSHDGADFKKYPNKTQKRTRRSIMKISSPDITINMDVMRKYKFRFDERFGLGAMFPTGEQAVFFKDFLDKKLDVMYVPKFIVSTDNEHSGLQHTALQWEARGAVITCVWGICSVVLIPAFAFIKSISLKRVTKFIPICVSMIKGSVKYKKTCL